jgi:sugar lactone lactonase YvrE
MVGSTAPLVDLETVTFVGQDLRRPECVVCDGDGALHVSDWRGGVTSITPDGVQCTVLAGGLDLRPNGIHALIDRSFLIAHLGAEIGGVYRLDLDGNCRPILTDFDGVPLPPTNFVLDDGHGRIWVTVSTRQRPRAAAYRKDVADGFIVVVDQTGAHLAADGLAYPNECECSDDGRYLYVNETFGRRLTRFEIADDGHLCGKTTIAEFGTGIFPDGLTKAPDGGWLVTSIVSNRVLSVSDGGTQTTILDDSDAGHIAWVEAAFTAGTMGRPHLDTAAGRYLSNISSLALGGPDGRTAYLGCLLGDAIATFRLPSIPDGGSASPQGDR